jgi:hypothetical protein
MGACCDNKADASIAEFTKTERVIAKEIKKMSGGFTE